MKALVVGLGMSGQAAAAFLIEKGFDVTGVDKKNLSLPGVIVKDESIDPTSFDLIVISPGIPLNHPILQKARQAKIEIIGEVELACRYLKGKVIGITGTNGKTTTTLLTTHILQSAGLNAQAVGNVEIPITSLLHQQPDIWVIELSSYQLETMSTPIIDVGIILNITPDHLDRYASMNAYAQAKLHIQKCMKPNGLLYLEEKCYQEFGHLLHSQSILTYGYNAQCNLTKETIDYLLPEEYRNRVSHEVENLMACYALCREFGITAEQMHLAIKNFKKPPHRIEFVRAHRGIKYYDDSKGTNIDAVIRAVQSLDGNIVLIAGGVDKGAPYTPWIQGFNGKVRSICAIGEAAHKLADQLGNHIPVTICSHLEAAIKYATEIAPHGSNILLSPGCSSFDMFRDYKHRGDEFKRVVNSL